MVSLQYKIIIVLLLFVYNFSFSQVPGYQGKRYLLHWNIIAVPNLLGAPTYDSKPNTDEGFTISKRNSFTAEYILNREQSAGISFEIYKTGVKIYVPKIDYGYMDIIGKLNGTALGFHIKTFDYNGSGSIAPLGIYRKWEFLYLMYNLDASYSYNYEYYGKNKNIDTSFTKQYTTWAITYTIGNQFIYFDRLVTNFGVQVGIIPAGLFSYRSEKDSDHIGEIESIKRLSRYFSFNLNLGLGVLIY